MRTSKVTQLAIFGSLLSLISSPGLGGYIECRYGMASDGQTYQLCETPTEVLLERAFNMPAPYDPFIDELIGYEVALEQGSALPRMSINYASIGSNFSIYDYSIDAAFSRSFNETDILGISIPVSGLRKHSDVNRFSNIRSAPIFVEMNNKIFGINNISIFSSVGIGFSYIEYQQKLKSEELNTTKNSFGISAHIGSKFSYEISEGIHLDFDYKYINTYELKERFSYSDHNFRFSLRFAFR